MIDSHFIFVACQAGAQAALKNEVEVRSPDWRLAFSRPGFVTFKTPSPITMTNQALPRMTFARTRGLSLGNVSGGNQMDVLAKELWQLDTVRQLVSQHGPLALHVWRRDEQLPGENGFEPGADELSRLVHQGVSAAAPEGSLRDSSTPPTDGAVLDVTLVEPTEWWVGAHLLNARIDRWPGGVPRIKLPEHAVSRAYLKMEEALRWSAMPTESGDVWVELGCAPGGASQALLDRGMGVLGVDPAKVDPVLEEHPDFLHLKMRAGDVRRKEFEPARWLAADINAAPQYTLDAVEPIVTHEELHFRGLLLTLKLSDWSLGAPDAMDRCVERVRGWGFRDVRLRQLAFNRGELCLAALKSRGQRRVRRRR